MRIACLVFSLIMFAGSALADADEDAVAATVQGVLTGCLSAVETRAPLSTLLTPQIAQPFKSPDLKGPTFRIKSDARVLVSGDSKRCTLISYDGDGARIQQSLIQALIAQNVGWRANSSISQLPKGQTAPPVALCRDIEGGAISLILGARAPQAGDGAHFVALATWYEPNSCPKGPILAAPATAPPPAAPQKSCPLYRRSDAGEWVCEVSSR